MPDALELLLQLHCSGEMHIVRYHEMSHKQREGERKMVLAYIKRRHALASPSPVDAFLRETFPDLWEEVAAHYTTELHATSLEPSIHSRSK
ncbi:MAG: hypothetical protein LBM74_10350 [Oscillospiraceae bacterium]|nr:hypothetical protein [Oscillospiraceae bacterium]